ncbi:MAG: type II toxin-antitoxin system RelE/ParE family toxin [Planctomycetes bacterium]|nr:type II toxin-antitoxin system RelE/ParE family toxin [Planctomycetota bacterium]
MAKKTLVYSPRAQEDLAKLQKKYAVQILNDLPILESPPWPRGKVKKLKGTDYCEIKTGDFRTIFWPHGNKVVILRAVDRRDLLKTIKHIDPDVIVRWLNQQK